MAVVIRLARQGRTNRPHFRVQVADSQFSPHSGRVLDNLGTYDPTGEKEKFEINQERLQHWLGRGAKVTHRVRDLVKRFVTPTTQKQ